MSSRTLDDQFNILEQQFRNSAGDPVFLPLFFGISMSSRSPQSDQSQESGQDQGRTININMIVINSGGDGRSLEELISELGAKEGLKPATQDSIQSMPKVVITEQEKDKECSICLDGWEIGDEAKEMPCKHLYHGKCIEKWLGMHGSCPVCRYKMPLDEFRKGKDESGREELQGERGIRFSFGSFGDGVGRSSIDDMDIN